MKKLFLSVVVSIGIMFFVGLAWASPFLVCDPQPDGNVVDYYKLEINGTVQSANITPQADTSAKIDLKNYIIPDGKVTFRLQAGNQWGVSNWSLPLTVTKGGPSIPMSLKLAP